MSIISDNEVWHWHKVFEDYEGSKLRACDYCRKNNIEYRKFNNMRRAFMHQRETNPMQYKLMMELANQCNASNLPVSIFAKKHNVDRRALAEVITHINYLKRVEHLKLTRDTVEVKSMSFVAVPRAEPRIPPVSTPRPPFNPEYAPTPRPPVDPQPPSAAPEAEIVEEQNSIELFISKGVKVSVSPEVPAEKIIKIIQLLKDL